jgi:hypothetical protein
VRLARVEETLAKYTVEATSLKARIDELDELIAELEADDDETDEVEAVVEDAPVLEYSNA